MDSFRQIVNGRFVNGKFVDNQFVSGWCQRTVVVDGQSVNGQSLNLSHS